MKRMHKSFAAVVVAALLLLFTFPLVPAQKASAKALDEILDYDVTVDVNEDATLNITYEVSWAVLDSTSEGPLEWIKFGIPNQHYVTYEELSDTIRVMTTMFSSGSYMRIDLDRAYTAGEIVTFKFLLVQDNMYQMNNYEDGYTVYSFTPGWFDDIQIDHMAIHWNDSRVSSWSPSGYQDGGYITFDRYSMEPGERFTVDITYANDAFAFAESHQYEEESYGSSSSSSGSPLSRAIITLFPFLFMMGFYALIGYAVYKAGRGLGSKSTTTTKITRTKIEYYPSCQGCGGTRAEGEKNCPYCGRSFVKSEEIVKEDQIPEDMRTHKINGEFRYSDSPNTYLRVNVTHVRVPVHTTHSSCAHSSCAHSSCACACACACAGGGRAGCTTKDFYNTRLKLRQIKRR